jgi:hypothetical protein
VEACKALATPKNLAEGSMSNSKRMPPFKPKMDPRQFGEIEVRMLRAVMVTTARDAARFGFSSSIFQRCQVRAWRVARQINASVSTGNVPVELVVTCCNEVLSREVGSVDPSRSHVVM